MPRYEFEISAYVQKRGKIQVDARNEDEAYEKVMNNLDSYKEDIEEFDTIFTNDIEVDTYTIIEEE